MLVFTDLDGTLIDHDTYSWEKAKPALRRLKTANVPLIPCTSKTRAEIEHYREAMGLEGPFISENGGGVFIPEGYFKKRFKHDKKIGGYLVIELGAPYSEIRKALEDLRNLGTLVGFGDLKAEEVAEETGLSLGEARLAKQREYDEAFTFVGDDEALQQAIEEKGLKWTRGGRYWHIMGKNDKGEAVRRLAEIFKKVPSPRCSVNGRLKTVGLGDSLNDLPMLLAVDAPILVQKKEGGYDPRVEAPGLVKAKKPGPEGWNAEVLKLLK